MTARRGPWPFTSPRASRAGDAPAFEALMARIRVPRTDKLAIASQAALHLAAILIRARRWPWRGGVSVVEEELKVLDGSWPREEALGLRDFALWWQFALQELLHPTV